MQTNETPQSENRWYKKKGMIQKNFWMNPETVYRIQVYAARESQKRNCFISFTSIVNEILDAKARELPDR